MTIVTEKTEYELVVGMECHAELLTESKMFCACKAEFGGAPNTRTCPVCLGLPGSLPVPNQRAIDFVVRTALATGCEISTPTVFARKNYFYPDMPKAYQISQYEDPIGKNGHIDITVDGQRKRIRIRRIHLEEDAGKLMHVAGDVTSLVDYNRAGVPLMEIVTEPDIHSPDDAREFLLALRSILLYLGVNDGKMEEGSFRAEPNISIHKPGEPYGTRTELKNVNSLRVVTRGIEAEMARQKKLLESGGTVQQATLRWDEPTGTTSVMRYKESEADYRYFPDPDLIPLEFSEEYLAAQRAQLPELPAARARRFMEEYGLSEYDAGVLTAERAVAEYFEDAAKLGGDAKAAANWISGDMARLLNAENIGISEIKVTPEHLGGMIRLIQDGTISGKIAKTVFEEMFRTGKPPKQIVEEKGLVQVTDASAIDGIVDQVIAQNPKEAERYRAGEEKLLGFFVGQVMKLSRGKANPAMANEAVRKKLGA